MKVLKVIGIALLSIIALVLILFFILSRDEPLKDDSSLKLNIKNITNDNSYPVLVDAVNLLQEPLSPNGANSTFLQEQIEANQKAIDKFISASDKNAFSTGEYINYETIKLSETPVNKNLAKFRTLIKLSTQKSLNDFKTNKKDQAVDDTIKALKVSYVYAQAQEPLISYLIGRAMQGFAVTNLETFKKDYVFSDSQKQEIARYKDTKLGLVMALKLEYWFGRNEIRSLIDPKGSSLYNKIVLKSNATTNLFTQHFLDLISYVQSDCSIIKEIPIYDIVASEQKAKINYLEPNWKGKVIADMFSVSFDSVKKKECDKQAKIEALLK